MDEQKTTAAGSKPTAAKVSRRGGVWQHVLLGLVIFVCGMLVGAGASVWFIHRGVMNVMEHGMPDPGVLIAHIDSKLDLTDEQELEVAAIFEREFGTVRTKRQEMATELHAHYGRIRDDVAAVLTAEQREVWMHEIAHAEKLFMPFHHGKHLENHGEHSVHNSNHADEHGTAHAQDETEHDGEE